MSPASRPEGPGSVSGAPTLPDGFADTFASRFDIGELVLAGSGHWVAEHAIVPLGR